MTNDNDARGALMIPEGWKLVPIEPTREMWDAVNKLDDQMAAGGYDGKGCSIEQAWNCLLDHAPASPKLPAGDGLTARKQALQEALAICEDEYRIRDTAGRTHPEDSPSRDRCFAAARAAWNCAAEIRSLLSAAPRQPGEVGAGVPEGFVVAPHYRGYARLGAGAYMLNHSKAGMPAELVISMATDEEKAGRVVGDERDNPDGYKVQPEAMAVRLRFENVAGLDALEQQLRHLRGVHFAASAQQEVDAGVQCETCNDVGMIGGRSGQTPENYQEWAEPCPDCNAEFKPVAPLPKYQCDLIATMIDEWYYHADKHVKEKLSKFSQVLLASAVNPTASAQQDKRDAVKVTPEAAYDRYFEREVNVPGMPGIWTKSAFIAGWHEGRLSSRNWVPMSLTPEQVEALEYARECVVVHGTGNWQWVVDHIKRLTQCAKQVQADAGAVAWRTGEIVWAVEEDAKRHAHWNKLIVEPLYTRPAAESDKRECPQPEICRGLQCEFCVDVGERWLHSVNIDAAARTLAECMDYPWEPMPEQGRLEMKKHARRVIDAAMSREQSGGEAK